MEEVTYNSGDVTQDYRNKQDGPGVTTSGEHWMNGWNWIRILALLFRAIDHRQVT